MATQQLPLAGIRVIDYTHFLAGPYLTRCLAALGAEVIKIERPTSGDAGRDHPYFIQGQSGYFLQQNMGKEGVCINIKDPRGLEMMHKLVRSADVFVENYRPGALEKLGLGYEKLAEQNPGLVYCSISAYGHTGPDSHRPGFGLIAEAKSGIMAMVGEPGEAPPLLRVALGDLYTGIHGVAAVCAALLGRVKSGRGQHIDMALYDTLMSM
nr:CoA transferase [Sphaerotilus sp.]